MAKLHRFNSTAVQPETWSPPPERVRGGRPEGELRNGYSSADGKHAGVWSSGVGAWEVVYTEWEYCLVLQGRARITGTDGEVVEIGPGDSLVLEPGFTGLWEVLEPMTKAYVIDDCGPAAP